MRKGVVALGLALLVVGIFSASVSTREPYITVEELTSWDPIVSTDPDKPYVLDPPPSIHNGTLWGYGPIPEGGQIELNITTSGPVRVTISSIQQSGDSDTIYNRVGTLFTDVVSAGGTCNVEIKNQGTEPVGIVPGSNLSVTQRLASYREIYRYAGPGGLVAAVGAVLLALGLVAKSTRRPQARKSRVR